jgi:hypothetical protein
MKIYIVSCTFPDSNHIAGAYVTRAAATAVATEMSGADLDGEGAVVVEVEVAAEVALDFGGNKPAVYPLTCEGVLALARDMLNDGAQNVCAPPVGARLVDGGARG